MKQLDILSLTWVQLAQDTDIFHSTLGHWPSKDFDFCTRRIIAMFVGDVASFDIGSSQKKQSSPTFLIVQLRAVKRDLDVITVNHWFNRLVLTTWLEVNHVGTSCRKTWRKLGSNSKATDIETMRNDLGIELARNQQTYKTIFLIFPRSFPQFLTDYSHFCIIRFFSIHSSSVRVPFLLYQLQIFSP